MTEEQLHGLLRSLEDDREADPAFADALFARLVRERPDRRPATALLAAAAVLVAVIGVSVAIGSGLVQLPFVVEPSASEIATPEASTTASTPASAPAASPSASATADTAIAGRALVADADGIRLRSEPSEDAEAFATLRSGQRMGATGQVRTVDGMTWYEVRIGPGDAHGWVASGPEATWLRMVEDGAVTFLCDGCGEESAVVSVTPFGNATITPLAPATELSEWRWSPDGTRLVASSGGTRLPYRIVILNPDGTQAVDLGIGSAPSWSPDGTRLAWLGDGGAVVTDADLAPEPLNLGGVVTGAPLWSPDGTRFGFIASEGEQVIDAPASIYVAPVDGGEPRRLTDPGYPGFIVWAPDGSGFGTTFVDLSGQEPARAFFVPLDGGDLVELFGGDAAFALPAWSPDGTRLAMSTTEGLLVGDGFGGDAAMLVAAGPGEFIGEVRWSPTGAWLLFTVSMGREPTMWIVPSDGSEEPRQISPEGAGAGQAEWQPVLVPLP